MFRDDDPGLAELRAIALGFPEAFEKVSHGRPVFFAPKMFAMYGGSSKETGGAMSHPYPHSCWSRSTKPTAPALEQDARFFYPAYLGPSGWLGPGLHRRRRWTGTRSPNWSTRPSGWSRRRNCSGNSTNV